MKHATHTEKSIEHLLARELRALETQSEQDRDAEFRFAIEDLLNQLDLSAAEAARVLLVGRPEKPPEPRVSKPQSKSRLKVFRNPYTRETLKTHSFDHETLDEWRKRHGRLTVQTWQIR